MNSTTPTTLTILTGRRAWNLTVVKTLSNGDRLAISTTGKEYRIARSWSHMTAWNRKGTRVYTWTITNSAALKGRFQPTTDRAMTAEEALKAFPQLFADMNPEMFSALTGLAPRHDWRTLTGMGTPALSAAYPEYQASQALEVLSQGFRNGWFT